MVLRKDIIPVSPDEFMLNRKPDRFLPPWHAARRAFEGINTTRISFDDLLGGLPEEKLVVFFRNLRPIYLPTAVERLNQVVAIQKKIKRLERKPGRSIDQERKTLNYQLVIALLSFLLILTACSTPPSAVGSTGAQETNQAATMVAEITDMAPKVPTPVSEPVAATPILPTPTEVIETAVVEHPTAVPTEAPPPTLEVAPIPPEVPFRVENGIVEKWTVNPETNQEEWVLDESFPYEELEALAKENHIRKYTIGSITKDLHGNFAARDLNYGRDHGRSGTLRAIKIGDGTWQASHQFSAAEHLPQNADQETMTALPEFGLPPGYTIDGERARAFRSEFIQKLIDLNPEFFNAYTGNSGTSIDNVLRVARENGNLIPFQINGVPDLIMPTTGRIDTIYISHDPKRAGVGHDINIGNIGVLIFDPKTMSEDARIEAFLQSVNIRHTLSHGTPGFDTIVGMAITDTGNLVFINGQQWDVDYSKISGTDPYFEDVKWWKQLPEEAVHIIAAFLQGYLKAFDPEHDDKMFAPLIPYYEESDGNVCTGGRNCGDPIQPAIQFIQLATQ